MPSHRVIHNLSHSHCSAFLSVFGRVRRSVWRAPTFETVLTACPLVPLEWMTDRGDWSSNTPTGRVTVNRVTTTAHRGETGLQVHMCVFSCVTIIESMNVEDNDAFMCHRCSGPGLNDCLEAVRLAVSRWVFPPAGQYKTQHNAMSPQITMIHKVLLASLSASLCSGQITGIALGVPAGLIFCLVLFFLGVLYHRGLAIRRKRAMRRYLESGEVRL